MNFCTQCGHELGIGRFCTNCGHPVDQDAHTAIRESARPEPPVEETRIRPAVPPPPGPSSTSASRFPLFADEVEDVDDGTGEQPVPYVESPTLAPPTGPVHSAGHRRRSVLPWVLGAAILLVLAVIGAALLLGNDDPTSPAAGTTRPASPDHPGDKPSASGDGETGGDTSGDTGGAEDVTRLMDVQAPPAASPHQDVDGNQVRYVATNMLDGVAETCWRTPGDASGETITFTLPQATEVTEVGLVNGYAKVASDETGTYNWYRGNRRITAVEWTFDDGTTISQDLRQTTDVQTVPVDGITTRTLSLRLVAVTPPGRGPSSRDYTAISDVSVLGSST